MRLKKLWWLNLLILIYLVLAACPAAQAGADYIEPPEDFYVVLSPPPYDGPTLEMGLTGNSTKTISDDRNGISYVEFCFKRKPDGKYYYKYRTYGWSYPRNYTQMDVFTPKQNGAITLAVWVDALHRVYSTFKVGANIVIYNETDIPVNVLDKSYGYDKIRIEAREGTLLVDGQVVPSGVWDTSARFTAASFKTCEDSLLKILVHPQGVSSVAWSPDGKYIASGGSDGSIVRLWNASDGSLVSVLGNYNYWVGYLPPVEVAFSPDGLMLASGYNRHVRLWSVSDNSLLRTLEGHTDYVGGVAFSPDGQFIASGSWDKTVKLWDAATGSLLRTLEGHAGKVFDVSFSPDGQILASTSEDKTVKLWDTNTGSLLRTLEGHTAGVGGVAFSPDGETIASGADDGVKLWRVSDGAFLRTLSSVGTWCLSFSPDGRYVACGCSDGVRILATGEESYNSPFQSFVRTLRDHSASVTDVAYSPDGQLIAPGSGDRTLKLWDANTGSFLRTLEGHTAGIGGVAFSLDGQALASGAGDDTVKTWDLAGILMDDQEGPEVSITCPAEGSRYPVSEYVPLVVSVADNASI